MNQPKHIHPKPLQQLNPDFVTDLIYVASQFTKVNLSWASGQIYSEPFSAYAAISGNIPPIHETKFKNGYERLKEEYSKRNKTFDKSTKTLNKKILKRSLE